MRLAFQRSLPETEIQSRFLDARILVADRQGATVSDPRPIGDGGYAPLISPDGRWVAYLKTSTQGLAPYFTELWVGDIETGRTRRISERFQMTGFFVLPAGLSATNLAWRGAGELLWVDADEALVPEIRRLSLLEESARGESIASLGPGNQIEDLRLSPNGDLGFSSHALDDSVWRLHVLSPDGEPNVVHTRSLETGQLRLAGVGSDGSSWIVLESAASLKVPARLEIFAIDPTGEPRRRGTLDSAVAATAVLAEDGSTLYLTAVDEGIASLVSFDLASGQRLTVTPNDLPGVTFCGIEPLADGGLLYSRQQRNADLWLLRRSAAVANTNP